MSKKFLIGDRTKDEWISVLDTENKKLEFTNHLASAKEFKGFEDTKGELKKLQEQTSGYFEDLQVYVLGFKRFFIEMVCWRLTRQPLF